MVNVRRTVSLWLSLPLTAFVATDKLSSRADLLATYPIITSGGQAAVFDTISNETFVSDAFYDLEGFGRLFEGISLYDGDLRIDSTSVTADRDFGEYADFLSDGLDLWLYDMTYLDGYGYSGRFDLESVRLEFSDPNHVGPDLMGYTIESVVRTVAVKIDSPGSDPNDDGNWTDFSIEGVFEIHGHPIPEPATLNLLLLGAGAALARRRRTGVKRDAEGQILTGDLDFELRLLPGDVTQNGAIDPIDQGAVLARFGLPVDESTTQFDVNTDEAINALDLGFVLSQFNLTAECPSEE